LCSQVVPRGVTRRQSYEAAGTRRECWVLMQRILVALDASPNASAVLDDAIDLAKRLGARILLLRAVGLPAEPLPANGFAAPPTQLVDAFIETAKRDLAELASRIPAHLFEGATAEVGVPWDAICSHARDHDVDLIVIGSHDYRLIDRILGTTAAKVVNHADRPVLVVRPKGSIRREAVATEKSDQLESRAGGTLG
jgi:nucleotide-binding universal stress UspA family protein